MAKPTRSKRKSGAVSRSKKPSVPKVAKPAPAAVPDEVVAEPPRKLANSWQLSRRALETLWRYRLTFGLILLAYFVLDLVLVHSSANLNIAALKSSLGLSTAQGSTNLTSSLSIYSSLFSAASGGTVSGGGFQLLVVLLISLFTICGLRHYSASEQNVARLPLRTLFYGSTYPLVPFVLILLLIGVQLVPLALGGLLYSLVVGSGIAQGIIEQGIFLVIFVGLAVLSLYWLTRTVIALYVVTLPDMWPMQAYKSAKELVKGRRFSVARKMLFLPVALFVVAAVIVVPCIIIWAPLAQWVFYVLSLLGVLVVNAYLYTLYRELLA